MQIIEVKNNIYSRKNIIDLLKKETCFIGIFSKYCGHCENMKPEWELLKKKLRKKTYNCVLLEIDSNEVNSINYTQLNNSIIGYPCIILFNKGKKIKEYEGNRTSNDMLKFLNKYLMMIKNNKKTKKVKKTYKKVKKTYKK